MKIYKIMALCGILAMMATSCKQEDTYDVKWEPGEPSDAVGVFFPGTDDLLSVSVAQTPVVELPISRLKAEGELEIPLVVTCEDPNVKVPESVVFEEGESDATIVINLRGLEEKQLTPLTVTVPDEYLNPYAGGRAIFEGNVIISDWTPVNNEEPIKFIFCDWSYNVNDQWDPVKSNMYHLEGTSLYRIEDFLKTGMDFSFELKASPYAAWEGYYRINPLDHQVPLTAYGYTSYYNAWWFADMENEEWPVLELSCGGQPYYLYSLIFYWYDDSQGEFCWARKKGEADASGNIADRNFAYMGGYAYYDEAWQNDTPYFRVYFEWEE